MEKAEIVKRTRDHVQQAMAGDATGHDWWHTERVVRVARRIAREERADEFVAELAALLHDLEDWKLAGGDASAAPRAARAWLSGLAVEPEVIDHVCDIIANVSFKGAGVPTPMRTKEGMAVQDADRLDAIGAIGIARVFAYGGSSGRAIHDPDYTPRLHDSFEEYKVNANPSIAHFYEKLLLLKDRMNTATGRRIAEGRHAFMVEYLDRFYREWDGDA